MKKKNLFFWVSLLAAQLLFAQTKLYTEQYRPQFHFPRQPTGATILMGLFTITAAFIYFTSIIRLEIFGGI